MFHAASNPQRTLRSLANVSGAIRLLLVLLALPAVTAGAVASLALMLLVAPVAALGLGGRWLARGSTFESPFAAGAQLRPLPLHHDADRERR